MARGLNKAMLIGNLGSDPEVRSTTAGDRVATLSVATSDQWTDKSGEKQEATQWHRVVCWNKLAEIVEKYCSKGDRVYIEGAIQYRTWEDREGNTKYTTEIKAFQLVMLGGNGRSNDAERVGLEVKKLWGTSPVNEDDEDTSPADKPSFDEFPDALDADNDELPF